MPPVLRLLRPKQWAKNAFVFCPLIFAKGLFDLPLLSRALLAVLVFCLVSSAIYILNDSIDVEEDRRHPTKRLRPLASREISLAFAGILAAILLIVGICLSLLLALPFTAVTACYLALNIAYSLLLKRVPILDIMCISVGFVLRVLAGVFAIGCELSPWILMCTFFLALFIAMQKRHGELISAQRLEDAAKEQVNGEKNGTSPEPNASRSDEMLRAEGTAPTGTEPRRPGALSSRSVLRHYRQGLFTEMIPVSVALAVTSYSFYTISSASSSYMMITILFVIYGIFRYQMLAKALGGVEAPENALFSDKPLLINVLLWLCACGLILYLT
ncbi:MAG: decaprenyl-phosphate phosphoribosyltransferase [Coriobacteriales bacterium]|jgi:4-hydroxybenzoate polyprenyltransferase|nr:decaprenyl-phosphate phosphoribosyltransferase [Coriobacteriales bacterium]